MPRKWFHYVIVQPFAYYEHNSRAHADRRPHKIKMHFEIGLDIDWKTFEEFNKIAVRKDGMLSKCIPLHIASSFKLIWTIQWMRRQKASNQHL